MQYNNTPKSKLAVTSFVLAVLSFIPLLGIPLGIVAILSGKMAHRHISQKGQKGRRLATAGITLGILGFIFSVILSLVFIEIPIYAYIRLKFPKSTYPELYVAPTLHDIERPSVNSTIYSEFSIDAINFKVPWTQLPEQHAYQMGTQLQFAGGKSLSIIDRQYTFDLAADFPNEIEEIKNFFGADRINSDYDLYTFVLMSTPDEIRKSSSLQEAQAKSYLLILKLLIPGIKLAKDGIYSFATEKIKGFQLGDTSTNSNAIIYFFGENDELRIISVSASQPEIDFILSSLDLL